MAIRFSPASRSVLLLTVFLGSACGDESGPAAPPTITRASTPDPAPGEETKPKPSDGSGFDPLGGDVQTLGATPLGTRGLSANGAIQPRAKPTRYWFEYGPTPSYGAKTAVKSVGPKRTAHYKESWDTSVAGWAGGLNADELVFVANGGAANGYATWTEPTGDDLNHIDGIGPIHIVEYLHMGNILPEGFANPRWSGGDADLRDAKISMYVRGKDWMRAGTELVQWIQADEDPSVQETEDWRRANWAFTGLFLSDPLATGRWEKIEYSLANNTHRWSYGGENLSQERLNYRYRSLDESLAQMNCDILHVLTFVDPQAPPTGRIDIDEFEVSYANHSVLAASNGGQLVSAPPGSEDAGRLTDGWRNGEGRTWRSALNPQGPQEITYALAKPIKISAVQVHQDPTAPSKDFEIQVSKDQQTWTTLTTGVLPTVSPTLGPNYAFFIKRDLAVEASFVRIRVLSGYGSERWGLGEVEVFGTGAVETPDDDWYFVNTDITTGAPGATIHYRLVTETDGKQIVGKDLTFVVANGGAPEVITGGQQRRANGGTTLLGRTTAFGNTTYAQFEWGEGTNLDQKTPLAYAGMENTPRTVVATLYLSPGKTYSYRLVAKNAKGSSVSPTVTFVAQ